MKKGFTLIELLIVVAIIGVLATLLMSNFVGVRQRGRDAERKSDLRQMQSALEMYRADNGLYPLTAAFPACGTSFTYDDGGNVTSYMQKVPCDPSTGLKYTYVSNGSIYALITCLENVNDSQKDSPASISPCDASGAVSYTHL